MGNVGHLERLHSNHKQVIFPDAIEGLSLLALSFSVFMDKISRRLSPQGLSRHHRVYATYGSRRLLCTTRKINLG
jgi:hypothetical protein